MAQNPTSNRSDSRLLIAQSPIISTQFKQLADFLLPNDLLVLNNTKVIPARLYAQKTTGGVVEIMIERILSNHQVLAMMKSSRSAKIGTQLRIKTKQANQLYQAKVLDKQGYLYTLNFTQGIQQVLDNAGHIPLPPYIDREDTEFDQDRYQTVFAKTLGAVAAPTAGLHFDEALLAQLKNMGVQITQVTLHVGSGTFLPVKTDNILDHKMHSETIEVKQETIDAIKQTKAKGGRVIAIGTTAVRALESCALNSSKTQENRAELTPYSGETDIFITPGFEFKVIDKLITNFHLPKSSLLMLVSAFAGYDNIKNIYQYAINNEYRFFSYGDAMLLDRI